MFECPDLASQRAYALHEFPRARWKVVLAVLGNSTVLNSLLYKGDFPHKNIPGSTYDNFRRIFDSIFQNIWLRRSFFAQLCFFGELIHAEAALLECDPQHFEQVKRSAAECEVTLVQDDIVKVIAESKEEIDFVSLSDVPSFFKGPREKDYLQMIRDRIAPGGLVVVRGNLRVTQPDAEGFSHRSADWQEVFKAETTQLWKIDVYQRNGPEQDH
jgi:S-adenosylmethionine-diacylglycerol 3-amino-3-carboxypropyl transferase